LRTAVANEFVDRLKRELPQFRLAKSPQLRGTETFEWEASPALHFYLSLQPSPKYDEFTIEVGWSEEQGYPLQALNLSPYEAPQRGQMRFRMGGFWSDQDVWWQVARKWSEQDWDAFLFEGKELEEEPVEAALKNVPDRVENAFQNILKHAIPYFRSIAASRGIALPAQAGSPVGQKTRTSIRIDENRENDANGT